MPVTHPSCPWKKSFLTFFHLADGWKSRGFPRPAVAASCGGRRVPQSARTQSHPAGAAARRAVHGLAAAIIAACWAAAGVAEDGIRLQIQVPGLQGGLRLDGGNRRAPAPAARAEEQAAEPAAEDGGDAAAAQQREQMRQHARQMEQVMQPVLQAELELARRTCGSLATGARREVLVAGREAVTKTAAAVARAQILGQPSRIDPRREIAAAVAKAIRSRAPAAQAEAYEREQQSRDERRAATSRLRIVDKLDRQLELSATQRHKIEADLKRNWQASWLRELQDQGGMMINNLRPAPDYASDCIVPHLDDRQRSEWRAWAATAGWQRFGEHLVAQNWALDGQGMRPDPWWGR